MYVIRHPLSRYRYAEGERGTLYIGIESYASYATRAEAEAAIERTLLAHRRTFKADQYVIEKDEE